MKMAIGVFVFICLQGLLIARIAGIEYGTQQAGAMAVSILVLADFFAVVVYLLIQGEKDVNR